ncbi:HTH-type transcriptional activator Btr [compost metagenome]
MFQDFAFVVITDGEGFYQVNDGERQRVRAGSWFCFYPGVKFNYGPEEGSCWDEYYFTITGERATEWLEHWLQSPNVVKQAHIDDVMLNKIEMMFTLIDSGIPSNLDRAALMVEAYLYELISQGDDTEAGNRGKWIVHLMEDISSYLQSSQMSSGIASHIAARHHISVSTLRRVVHEYTGYPLNEFIHRLKVAEAKHILLNSDMSIQDISESLGYKDMFYFSKVFKRISGISPRNYRNRIGQ